MLDTLLNFGRLIFWAPILCALLSAFTVCSGRRADRDRPGSASSTPPTTVDLFGPPPAPPLLVYSQPAPSPSQHQSQLRFISRTDQSANSYFPSQSVPSTPANPSFPSPPPPSISQSTGKHPIRVLTTPFGLAWRNVEYFEREARTTPAIQTQATTDSPGTIATTQPTSTRRVSKRPSLFARTNWSDSPAPNRIKGKPHILCMALGIMFIAETYFPFDGVVSARGRENRTNCSYDSNRNNVEIRERSINVSFPYIHCGQPIIAKKGDHTYQTDVVVSFPDGRVQTFLARCVSQKLHYDEEELPKKMEEALAELNITPTRVESQAVMPMCTMRVVQELEQEQHKYGPSNGSEVNGAFIGQQLRMEFSLDPPSAAFGFLIRNCSVLDSTVGVRYVIIDDKGCSVDINIFAHPHYDTYHDLAIVHWHAFKVPDSALLSFRCDCVVCTEMTDDESGQTSCEQIPTPPVCPDVVTSSTLQNALIFDSTQNRVFAAKKKRNVEQNVQTGFCLDANRAHGNCTAYSSDQSDTQNTDQPDTATPEESCSDSDGWMCISKWTFAISLAFNMAVLVTASVAFFITTPHKNNSQRGVQNNIVPVEPGRQEGRLGGSEESNNHWCHA